VPAKKQDTKTIHGQKTQFGVSLPLLHPNRDANHLLGTSPRYGNNPRRPAPSTKTFIVHAQFICHHSPCFKAAFNSSMTEGFSKTMTLNDTTPPAFGLFVNWCYTSKLTDMNDIQASIEDFVDL
jgi:hypothetical protein